MAHRKLQQEVDRVFKKINEGLEIFDTYYERHENCTNNPSQKDKLESDLKREVKKLQRLREQIKSWQSSPDIKDKDTLLDYRRLVETAMEKYKAVEKASKEKAYSNISLKKSENLDPEEQERRDVSDYLSQQIDELERQYDLAQIEIDRLLLLQKKKKTATTANDEAKERMKALQGRFRWHQQQMEIALRLLANEELDPQDVKDIEEDIKYFIESNQDPDFVEDETIYESLKLQSNEAIAHEVAQYFASQASEDQLDDDDSLGKDASKLSKKEQRRLEREAKKAAKAAIKISDTIPEDDTVKLSRMPSMSTIDKGSISTTSPTMTEYDQQSTRESIKSLSPSPVLSDVAITSKTNPVTSSMSKSQDVSTLSSLKTSTVTSSITSSPESQGHTHIHQSQKGVITTGTLKPASLPIKPVNEMKWAATASIAIEKAKKASQSYAQVTTAAISNSLNNSIASTVSTPRTATPTLANPTLAQQLEKAGSLTLGNEAPITSNIFHGQLDSSNNIITNEELKTDLAESVIPTEVNSQTAAIPTSVNIMDGFESDLSEDEDDGFESKLVFETLSAEESKRRETVTKELKSKLSKKYELLLLPSGIQEYMMGKLISDNKLNENNGNLGGFRRSCDVCNCLRLEPLPNNVNPPTPLDAFRSTHQWDVTRRSLSSIWSNDITFDTILEKFRTLDVFTLFYYYYFAVTPVEKRIAISLLEEKNWKLLNNGNMWIFRQGEPKFINELCEIGDYKLFKAEDWTVLEKVNFKLDYTSLMNPPAHLTELTVAENNVSKSSSSESLSHGQQLLQQLNRGKISVTA